jgi:ABC-type multidrug transport system fused ATPase/permease subunit
MATNRDWANAYLAQARADLHGAQLVGAAEPSVFAMLMQMVFEKFAKAALLRSGAITLDWAVSSHAAASRMVAAMRLQRGLMDPMGGPTVWHDVLWAVEALERAHPAVAGGAPQLEYPCATGAGVVQWPASHLAIAASMGNPASNLTARVMRFAYLLGRRFDQIFP